MVSSFKFDTTNLGWSIVYIEGSWLYNFQAEIVFLSLKVICVVANSVDPDEILHYKALPLGLHCLP